MTKYSIHATLNDGLAYERLLWDRYYTTTCAQRGLRAGVDALDRRAGRVLPLAEADTTHVGHVRIVADTPLCEVPDAGGDVPDDAALVDRAALPAAVRDALDAEDIGASAQAQVRSR
jgi:hypothetical protein